MSFFIFFHIPSLSPPLFFIFLSFFLSFFLFLFRLQVALEHVQRLQQAVQAMPAGPRRRAWTAGRAINEFVPYDTLRAMDAGLSPNVVQWLTGQ